MNKLTAPKRQLASLIVKGKLELDELPSSRRGEVQDEIEVIRAELANSDKQEQRKKAKQEAKKQETEDAEIAEKKLISNSSRSTTRKDSNRSSKRGSEEVV